MEKPIKSAFFLEVCKQITDQSGKAIDPNNVHEVLSFEHACDIIKIGDSLPEFADAPAHMVPALQSHYKLCIIAMALNGDWKQNWDDYNQVKYYPWWDMRSTASGGFSLYDVCFDGTRTAVGARLVYRNRDTARFAGAYFEDLYRQYMK